MNPVTIFVASLLGITFILAVALVIIVRNQ